MFRQRRRSDTPPLTPAEQFRNDSRFTLPTASQSQSSLFNLPIEIQRMIFTELFGGKLVHIHLRRSNEKYEREGAPTKVPGWVHCVCHHKRDTVPHYHREESHVWSFLSTNILRACQSAPKDVLFFETLFVHFSSLIQSMDLYCAECGCLTACRGHELNDRPWRMDMLCQSEYYRLLFGPTSTVDKVSNMRIYFEDHESIMFGSLIRNLLSSQTLPVAQIQIFVHGDLDERSDKAIKVEATPCKRGRIKVITHASELLSDCYGEQSNRMTDETPTDNVQSMADSSPENNESIREGIA
ncbi:hypothetical protein NW766_002748 [Fusarium irregulare]|uniref:DUF7730 domain-containing protein n=1 Tax=Fusarium irregulare TaxID=2494466 RepID=A0A9W8UBB6_9HYPO|nr:hypothetical protein NW766_002748 [Fusarium irregulare]